MTFVSKELPFFILID